MESFHYHPGAGITLQRLTPNDCRIVYNGLLAQSGAEHVFLHVGYETNDHWENIYDYQMDRISDGWETKVNLRQGDMRFCFKDCAGNWDNNNGHNWSIREF